MAEGSARSVSAQGVPWYSLDPRKVRLHRVALPVVAFVLMCSLSEKHLWRWAWQSGPGVWYNCRPVADAPGHRVEAWRWVEGREIRLYLSGGVFNKRAEAAAIEIRELIGDVGLPVTVRVLPPPARVTSAIARNTTGTDAGRAVDFDRLCRELVATRDGRFAEMVYAPGIIDGSPEATGAALFGYGVAVLSPDKGSSLTARHEAAHLLGYGLHDNWPFAIIGYPPVRYAHDQGDDDTRQPLMLPDVPGSALSPRARDAIVYFWRGLARRTGMLEPK